VRTVRELEIIAEQRLYDAKALYRAKRYDGAIYICGYAIEVALKAAVCKHHGWADYPQSLAEYNAHPSKNLYSPYWTHNLNQLMNGSGMVSTITTLHRKEWRRVSSWHPESRYNPPIMGIGRRTKAILKTKLARRAQRTIDAVDVLLGVL
jgi:hypothetical protein